MTILTLIQSDVALHNIQRRPLERRETGMLVRKVNH